jgi:ABC-2 type transport system permease protein
MKKLFTLLCLDFKLILQDKIALYMALAPAILSFIFLAVIGQAGEGTQKLVVSGDVPMEIVERLETIADIETVPDYEALEKRINRADSIAGAYMDGEALVVLTEGNEKEGFAEKNALLVDRALAATPVQFQTIEVERPQNLVLTIVTASILLLGILIAGAVSGFNIVNERESGVIRALAVSPTGLASYIGIRTLSALLLGVVNVALSILIMGKAGLIWQMACVALASLFMYAIITVMVGSFADNLIASFAVMKTLMPVFLVIPVISAFVPENLHFLFYPLPMYWQYESIVRILGGLDPGFSLLMIMATGAFWFFIVFMLRKKVLNLRMEGVRSCNGIGGS